MSGEYFRQLLRDRDLTGVEVASRIGVHKNTVSNWTTGRTPVVPPHLNALAALLDVTVDELAEPPAPGTTPEPSAHELLHRALDVLLRLLDSAGAADPIDEAAPNLMDVLRDAERFVEKHGRDGSGA